MAFLAILNNFWKKLGYFLLQHLATLLIQQRYFRSVRLGLLVEWLWEVMSLNPVTGTKRISSPQFALKIALVEAAKSR